MSLTARDIPLDQLTRDEQWNLLDLLLNRLSAETGELKLESWQIKILDERLRAPCDPSESISLDEYRARRRSRTK